MMKLYYSPNLNPRVAVATARYLAAPLEFVRASPRDPNREDSYRPLNPTLSSRSFRRRTAPCSGRPTLSS
jgi:hypothetical protein